MSISDNFTQIETVQFEGMTFASVYDLVVWLKDLHADRLGHEDNEDELLLTIINQLTRLVSK